MESRKVSYGLYLVVNLIQSVVFPNLTLYSIVRPDFIKYVIDKGDEITDAQNIYVDRFSDFLIETCQIQGRRLELFRVQTFCFSKRFEYRQIAVQISNS